MIRYSLDLEALRKIPPCVFGMLMSLEPAMAVLIGLVVLQSRCTGRSGSTVLCVVVASTGAARTRPEG